MYNDSITIKDMSGHGLRFISGSESFVLGHYPDKAIFPGVLSLELLTEVCEWLVRKKKDQPKSVVTRIVTIRFFDIVSPGDVLHVEVTIKEEREDCCLLAGQIRSERGKVTAKGNFIVSCEPPQDSSRQSATSGSE